MPEMLKPKQDSTYWEWTPDRSHIEILWILETDDGRYYQKFKTIKIGGNSTPPLPVDRP